MFLLKLNVLTCESTAVQPVFLSCLCSGNTNSLSLTALIIYSFLVKILVIDENGTIKKLKEQQYEVFYY